MAVEFLILSGARQGERLELEGDEFRIGDGIDCHVRFDPIRDPGAKQRSTLIRREDDGWRIRNEAAGPVWLNQKPLHEPSPIRSSDVIRLSDSGPDLAFTIVTRRSSVAVPAPNPPAVVAAEAPAAPDAPRVPRYHSLSRPAPNRSHLWFPISAVIVSIALLAVLVMARLGTRKVENGPADLGKAKGPVDAGPVNGRKSAEGTERTDRSNAPQPGRTGEIKNAGDRPTVASSDDAGLRAVMAEKRGAVFALAVQSPGGILWSFGTCFGIRRDTLVTTATLACEFEKLRSSEKGWKLVALGAEQNVRIEVKELRVHSGYAQAVSAGRPPQFFDIALLTVADELPAICPIAPQTELDQIQRQTRVACLGISQPIPQEGERPDPIGRFDSLTAEVFLGRILDVAKGPEGSPAQQLLFLPNSFPPTLWGSPILNEAGRAVGVFSMVEQKDRDSSVAILVAPILRSVADWLQRPDSNLWVPPIATAQRATREKQ